MSSAERVRMTANRIEFAGWVTPSSRTGPARRTGRLASCAILISVACSALLSLQCPASPQPRLEPATLRLDWLASGYHVPFFLALERGFYREQGIDLQIADGKGSTTTLQVVASGSDTFGAANLSTTALGIARGIPAVAIAGLIQKSPDSVISLAGAGINSPKDMEGKRGGFVPTSASDRIFPAFAKSAGVDAQKIAKLQIESSARYSILLQGNADFVIGWSFTDAYKIGRQKPIAPPILFSDYGVNTLGVGVIVSRDTLEKRAPVVKGFLAATIRGIDQTLRDPQAAVEATMKLRPGADRDALLEAARRLGEYLHTKNSAAHPSGWMAPEDWEQSRHILVEYLGMKDSVPADTFFTNAYLPGATH
jgi:NitT/TauT family transport system substrate-binding protein